MQDLWPAKSSSNTLVLEEARATVNGVWFAYPFSLQLSKGIDWWKIGCGFWIGSLCRTMRPLTFLTFGSDKLSLKFDRGETYLQCRNDQACHPLLIWPLGKGWTRILKNTRQWAIYVYNSWRKETHITITTQYIYYIYYHIHDIGSWRKPSPCMIHCWYVFFGPTVLRWWGTSQHPRTAGEVVCRFCRKSGKTRIWKQILSQYEHVTTI